MKNNRKADVLAGKGSTAGKLKEDRQRKAERLAEITGTKPPRPKKKTGIFDW